MIFQALKSAHKVSGYRHVDLSYIDTRVSSDENKIEFDAYDYLLLTHSVRAVSMPWRRLCCDDVCDDMIAILLEVVLAMVIVTETVVMEITVGVMMVTLTTVILQEATYLTGANENVVVVVIDAVVEEVETDLQADSHASPAVWCLYGSSGRDTSASTSGLQSLCASRDRMALRGATLNGGSPSGSFRGQH